MTIKLKTFHAILLNSEGKMHLQEVDGHIAFEKDGVTLFVYRTPNGNYGVAELTTGLAFTDKFPRKKEAIDQMYERINRTTLYEIKKSIENNQERCKPFFDQLLNP